MIATYWEGRRPPDYMVLCMTSWLSYVPMSSVVLINSSNINRFLPDCVAVEHLSMYSFAKQSDIVSAHLLREYGGAFVDVDTVFTSEHSANFTSLKPEDQRLRYFGNKETNGVHIGALACNSNTPAISHWADELFSRVPEWSEDRSWSYVGNEIIEPFINSSKGKEFSLCFDVKEQLGTPETSLYEKLPKKPRQLDGRTLYENFWFTQLEDDLAEEIITEIESLNGGLVLLHNSWTPDSYSALTADEISSDRTLLSYFLRKHANFDRFDDVERLMRDGS